MHPVQHRHGREHNVCSARDAKLIQEILNVLVKNVLRPSAGIPECRTFNNQRAGVIDPWPVLLKKSCIFDESNPGLRAGRDRWEIAIEERGSAQNERRTALLNNPAIHFEGPRH